MAPFDLNGSRHGINPPRHLESRQRQSGNPRRVTSAGRWYKLLYEAANSILTRSKQSFALKITRSRGLRKARVALARRLAVIMHAMLRDGTLFEA